MNGRLKQGMYVWHHLIGVAAGFADLLIGLKMFTSDVGKTSLLYGMLPFETKRKKKICDMMFIQL